MKQGRTEVLDSGMPFLPYPAQRIVLKRELYAELMRPCARFVNPYLGRVRREARIARVLGQMDETLGNELILSSGTPVNWQLLLSYLHDQQLTESSYFGFSAVSTDLPHLSSVRLQSHADLTKSDGRAPRQGGFASTGSTEESMSRVVGELLERYALSRYHQKDLYRASYREASRRRKNPLDILKLNGFLPWQTERFPQRARSIDAPLAWVSGERYADGARTLLPAQLVFWNYQNPSGEMILAESNSNGCAGHFTREEAVLAGVLELIQRDGFFIHWLNGIAPRQIDPSTIVDPEVRELLLKLRRYQIEYYLLNTTTDVGVPSCTCVLIDRLAGEPTVAIGASAGFSLREILSQSIGEALSILRGVESTPGIPLKSPYTPFIDPKITRTERLAMWRGTEAIDRIAFFLRGERQSFEAFMGESIWYDTPEKQLAYIQKRFCALGDGYEMYVYESSDPVLARVGFHAVRVIVPKLFSLYLRESIPTLGAARLKDVPDRLGYERGAELTPWPHPFP